MRHSPPLCSFDSADGVPFLMHDEKLTRTTDVQKVFPERADMNSTAFNWTDLQQLNAGNWFLEVRMGALGGQREPCPGEHSLCRYLSKVQEHFHACTNPQSAVTPCAELL